MTREPLEPGHPRPHAHEIAIRMAALNPAVQALISSVKVARHHLKHGRVEAADRVLRQATEER